MKITTAVTSVIFSALMSSAFASESGSDKQAAFESGLPSIGNLIDKLANYPTGGDGRVFQPIGSGGRTFLLEVPIGGGVGAIPIGSGGIPLPIIPDFPLPIPGKP